MGPVINASGSGRVGVGSISTVVVPSVSSKPLTPSERRVRPWPGCTGTRHEAGGWCCAGHLPGHVAGEAEPGDDQQPPGAPPAGRGGSSGDARGPRRAHCATPDPRPAALDRSASPGFPAPATTDRRTGLRRWKPHPLEVHREGRWSPSLHIGYRDGTGSGTLPSMVIIPGPPAFSPARLEKRLARLRQHHPGLTDASADFVHVLDVERALTDGGAAHADAAADLRPAAGAAEVKGQHLRGGAAAGHALALVVEGDRHRAQLRAHRGAPHRAGHRLDARGRRSTARPALHDRMTESLLPDLASAERLFERHTPRPLTTVPVLRDGRGRAGAGEHRAGARARAGRDRLPGGRLHASWGATPPTSS